MLTTEELMLVNNLIYLEGTSKEHPFLSLVDRAQIIDDNYAGLTVRDFLDDVMKCPFTDNNNRAFISGLEWQKTIRAIEANPKLLDLEIVTGQKDTASGGGEGESVLLVDHSSKEAIFVFRGTADKEWYDDFYGGGPTNADDRVSTPQQENALEWYDSVMSNDDYGYLDDYYITVTGHSKGGNKAKYITILEDDNPVDRCVSLDGQGFSDEFFAKYPTQIDARQGLIENHNVEYDFVNLLLNDVGNRYFYKVQQFGGNVFEFHSPNTFYKVDQQGNIYTQYTGSQPPLVMQEIDELVNGLLRSMPSNMRGDALRFIGISFESFWNYMWTGRFPIEIPILLTDLNNWEIISYLMEYMSIDVLVSIYCNIVISNGGTIDETFINTFIDLWNQNCPIDLLDIDARIQNGDDLIIRNCPNQADMLKNLKNLIAAGAVAGVAAVAAINAKNSEEEHFVHDNMYFGPRPDEEGAEHFVSGAEQLAEIGVLDEEYEHKNDYGGLSHGGGMYEHIGSAMDETEEGYSGGYNSHGGAFYHDLEQEESGMGGAGSHGLSNGFQMGALAGLEVENSQNSAASFAGQFADNNHGFDEFVVGTGFSSAAINGATIGAKALSKNGKSFMAILTGMTNGQEKLLNASNHMSAASTKVNNITNITIGTTNSENILNSIKTQINQENKECKELHLAFSKIKNTYKKNEESLTTKQSKQNKINKKNKQDRNNPDVVTRIHPRPGSNSGHSGRHGSGGHGHHQPAGVNTHGKEYPEFADGFIVVDDMDYLPLSDNLYNRLYVDDAKVDVNGKDVQQFDRDGNPIVGMANLHNSLDKPEGYSPNTPLTYLFGVAGVASDLVGFNNGKLLNHYFYGNGETLVYDARQFLYLNEDIKMNYDNYLTNVILSCEGKIADGETVIIATSPSVTPTGCSGYDNSTKWEKIVDFDAWTSVNSCQAGIVCEITREGDHYTMDYNYYLIDYYDYDNNPEVLYDLNVYGYANNYLSYGKISDTIEWNAGDY